MGDIGPVDREGDDDLCYRRSQTVQGVIPGVPVLLSEAVEIMAEPVDLARHGGEHDQPLFLINQLLVVERRPDKSGINLVKCLDVRGIHENAVQRVEEGITDCAEDRPVFRHPLSLRKDLFADDVERLELRIRFQDLPVLLPKVRFKEVFARGCFCWHPPLDLGQPDLDKTLSLQSSEVLGWIVQTVRVVYPQTGNLSLSYKPEDESMGLLKDCGVFHSDGRKGVDVKKSSVVDLFGGNPPVGEPPYLLTEQLIEEIEAVRFSLDAVEGDDVGVKETSDLLALGAQRIEATLDGFFFAAPLDNPVPVLFRVCRQASKSGQNAQQLDQMGVIRGHERPDSVHSVCQHR